MRTEAGDGDFGADDPGGDRVALRHLRRKTGAALRRWLPRLLAVAIVGVLGYALGSLIARVLVELFRLA